MADLKSKQIISTGPFEPQRWGWSKPEQHFEKWLNNIDSIQIYKVQIWMGMDIKGKGDFWFRLQRESDGSLLGHTNWDHYAEPSGAMNNLIIYDYAPNWFQLDKDDILILSYGAKRWNPFWPIIMRGDISITIWYTINK